MKQGPDRMAKFEGVNSGYADPDRGRRAGDGVRGAQSAIVRASDAAGRPRGALGVLPALDPFADGVETPIASGPAPMRSTFSVGALLRFKWTMLAALLAVAGATLAAIWTLMVPEYRSKATIEIPPGNPRVLYRTEDSNIPYYTQYFNGQPSLIRGAVVVSRVLEQPAVQQTAWYREPKKTLLGGSRSRTEALRDALSAEPRPGTYMIDVSFGDRDPHDAQVILAEVVNQYLAYAREAARESDDTVLQKLLESRQELEAAIERRKVLVNELQRDLGAASSADVVPRGKSWIEDRQAKLEELRRELTTAVWQEQELSKLVEGDSGKPGDSGAGGNGGATSRPSPRFADDPEWRRLHLELRTAQHEMEANPRQWGPQHPEMVALRKKIELLTDLLAEQEGNLTRQWAAYAGGPPSATGVASSPSAELATLRRRIGVLKKQEELLVAETQRRETDYESRFDTAKRLDKETEALRYDTEKYDLVRRRMDEKETEGRMSISTRLAAPAFLPSSPERDRRSMLSLAAVLGALAAAVGAGYLRLCTNSSIHEIGEFAPAARAPFLGNLPLLRRPERPSERETALQSECVRMVRTALMERLSGDGRFGGRSPRESGRHASRAPRGGNTVLVTSAGPGVGKTTLTCLLGQSLAHAGQRVLLVEADLRNPAVCQRLGIPAGPGLIDLLRANGHGRQLDDQVIVPCSPAGLHVLPAGHVCQASDPEFLASRQMLAGLERWRKQFDIVLLDSSPVLPVADGRILARQVDGTIMVAREGHCRRSEIVSALASLGVAGAKMLGTVFISSVRSADYRPGYYNYLVLDAARTLDVHDA
jgi:polysaccharide biosynthesis transport protein